MLTPFWETQDRTPAAGQPWEGRPAGRPGGGRASVCWRLPFVFAEAKAAKTTSNCWEASESGLMRTALPGRRAPGSRPGRPRPHSPAPPSGRRPRPRPPESPQAPTAAPAPHRPWLQGVLLLPCQPRAPGAWSAELCLCEPAVWDVPARGWLQAVPTGPEDAEEMAVHSKGPRHPHT